MQLPMDVWTCVCSVLPLPSVDALMSTCKHLRVQATESFYLAIAIHQWGSDFWSRALTRECPRKFMGMRDELRFLYLFERDLKKYKMLPWTAKDYHAFWDFQEDGMKRSKEGKQRALRLR